MRRAAATLLFVLTACAAPIGASPESSREENPTMDPTPTPRASFGLASQQPSVDPEGTALTGLLGSDAVEGGCAYLQASDGTRYEVIYPDGWTLQKSPLQLRAPDGEIVARAGDEVTVSGTEATDMASICMIGPIFRATEVVH